MLTNEDLQDSARLAKEREIFIHAVYECLFYNDKKWPVNSQYMFFDGQLIHYRDFMKAKRGSL